MAAIPGPKIVSDYLYHFLRTIDLYAVASSTTVPSIRKSDLAQLTIPLPSPMEQRRIAKVLNRAEALRAQRRAILTQLDSLAQSIFVDLFGDDRTVLERWPTKKLGDLLDFLTSGSRGWAKYYSDSGDLFLRIQNVRRDELALGDIAYVNAPDTAEARRTRVQPGDVLLSITADLGRTAVVPDDIGKAFINQHLSILRTKALVPRFLSAYLTSPLGQRQIMGRNRQAVKAGLNFDDIRSFVVPLPPFELQGEFARRVGTAEQLKAPQSASLIELNALFVSLQHQAFRGEL
ncbi:MAG: restriction endonuclease subunit S [Aestuariivirga sp.]